jgi:hypothetical protein
MRWLIPLICSLLLAACSRSDYAIVSEKDFPSPDGRFVASVVEDTHFDTTGYDKHVSLRTAGQRRPHPGNVGWFGPGDEAKVTWVSPTNLLVRYAYEVQRDGPRFTNLLGVAVTYKQESWRDMVAERDGAADGSQPSGPETNRASSAAGSRR